MNQVSVIIPTKDRLPLLKIAVDSVLNQTYNNIEVIIIDDCSESYMEMTHFHGNPQVRVFRNDKSIGGGGCRKKGTELASGDFICFLDDDDTFSCDKVEVLLTFLEENPLCDAVFGAITKLSTSEVVTNRYLNNNQQIKNIKCLPGLHTNTSLVRKSVFNNTNFLPELVKYQDTQFHIELIKKHNVCYVNHPVAMWNDKHEGAQITDLNTLKSKVKSVIAFEDLLLYLNKLAILNFYEKIHLVNKLFKLYGKYNYCLSYKKSKMKFGFFSVILINLYKFVFKFKRNNVE